MPVEQNTLYIIKIIQKKLVLLKHKLLKEESCKILRCRVACQVIIGNILFKRYIYNTNFH